MRRSRHSSPPKTLVGKLRNLLENVAASYNPDELLNTPHSSILDLILSFGFDNYGQMMTTLGSYSYDLVHNVLDTWPEDAPFVKWLCDHVNISFRKVKLDIRTEERLLKQLRVPDPIELSIFRENARCSRYPPALASDDGASTDSITGDKLGYEHCLHQTRLFTSNTSATHAPVADEDLSRDTRDSNLISSNRPTSIPTSIRGFKKKGIARPLRDIGKNRTKRRRKSARHLKSWQFQGGSLGSDGTLLIEVEIVEGAKGAMVTRWVTEEYAHQKFRLLLLGLRSQLGVLSQKDTVVGPFQDDCGKQTSERLLRSLKIDPSEHVEGIERLWQNLPHI